MKHNFFKIVAVLVFTVLAVSTSVAQTSGSATATASALIIAPIGITETSNMNFGNVVTTPVGGTVVLAADGSRTTPDLFFPVTPGTVTAAVFSITADASYYYTITIPTTDHQISNSNSKHMQVNTWVTNQVTALNAEQGNVTLRIGATLNVGAAQDPGAYVSDSPFSVTVGYN